MNDQALRHVPAMAPGGGPFLAAPVLPPPPGRTGSRFLNRFRALGPPRPPGGAPLCIWAGERNQGEVLAEVILVLEFLACESTAAVLVVVTDTGRKS